MTPDRPLNLREERVNRGLSERMAAAEMGIARETLLRAERGERPHPAQGKKIADFYGVRVTDLWPLEDVAA